MWYSLSNNSLLIQTNTLNITELTLIAAKLELGPVQTLAHQDADGNWVLNDPPPNFQQELAKCQRYYWKSETSSKRYATSCFKLDRISGTNVRLENTVSCPVTMSTRPDFRINGISPGGIVTMRSTMTGSNISGTLLSADPFTVSVDKLYGIWIKDYTGTIDIESFYEGTIELDADL